MSDKNPMDAKNLLAGLNTTEANIQFRKSVKRKKFWTGVLTSLSIFLVAGVFVLNVQGWFRTTDYSQRVALSENIARFSIPSWEANGEDGNSITNKFGTWSTNGGMTFSNDSSTCTFTFTRIGGMALSNTDNDEDATEAYYTDYIEANAQEVLDSSTTWLYSGVGDGQIEMFKTTYVNDLSKTVAFYRVASVTTVAVIGSVTCSDDEEFDTLVGSFDTDADFVEGLGFSFKG